MVKIMGEKMLNLQEASAELAMSEVTLRRRVKEGAIGIYRHGGKGQILIPEASLREFVERGKGVQA